MPDEDTLKPDESQPTEPESATTDDTEIPANTYPPAPGSAESPEPSVEEYDPYADHEDYYHESPFKHPDMSCVSIPPSPLEHGKLAMGGWAFGGGHWGQQDDNHSRSVMEASVRRGMNHFDTADWFGRGRSEMLIAKFLEADYHRREGIFLASQTMMHEPDPLAVIDRLNESLDRLDTYWIDLFYVTWPRPGVDMRPVMQALESARDEGKIKCIGIGQFTMEQIEQAREACEINACQVSYNLLWRHDEKELLEYCHINDIAVIATSPLAQGILSGKFSDNSNEQPRFAEGDIRKTGLFFEPDVWPHVQDAVQRFRHVAREAQRPLSHLALRWIDRNFDIRSIVVGARNSIQLNELAGAMSGEVNDDLLDQLTVISDEFQAKLPQAGNIFRYYP